MGLSHEHIGPNILAKIKIYILTRAELLFPLCYEIPCKGTIRKSFGESCRSLFGVHEGLLCSERSFKKTYLALKSLLIRLHTKNGTLEGKRPFWSLRRWVEDCHCTVAERRNTLFTVLWKSLRHGRPQRSSEPTHYSRSHQILSTNYPLRYRLNCLLVCSEVQKK